MRESEKTPRAVATRVLPLPLAPYQLLKERVLLCSLNHFPLSSDFYLICIVKVLLITLFYSMGSCRFELFTFFAFSFPRHQLLFTTREEDWDLVKAKGTCYSNSRLKEFRVVLNDSHSSEELCKVCVRNVTMLYQDFYFVARALDPWV